ncbi:MAG TPA: hypothetical protein PKE00_03440 [Planctomycetota bacterium]|nr:hypothetical protein [Planctomycetota bacterium]
MQHLVSTSSFPHRAATLCLAAIVAAADCRSQSTAVVVPASASAVDGNRWMNSHFRERDARRIQLIIGAQHVASLSGKRLSELAFRKDTKYVNNYKRLRGGEQTSMRILASWSDADPAKPALRFASNHGSTVVEVFRGVVALPKVSPIEDRSVASFDPREAPTIPFSTALPHVASKSLVLEFLIDGGAKGYSWNWPVDAVTSFQPGKVTPFGKTCWDAQRQEAITIVRGSLRPGMHIKTECVTPPNPLLSFQVFGLSNKLAYGALPLPLRIAEPACDLLVSPDVMVTTKFFAGPDGRHDGWTGAEVATPTLTSLYGATLFFQYIFLQQQGTQLGLRTSNGVEATFTTKPPSLDLSLVATMDMLAENGRVFLDFAPVLQISAR